MERRRKQRYLVSGVLSLAVHLLLFPAVGVLSQRSLGNAASKGKVSRIVSSAAPEEPEAPGGATKGGRRGIPGEILRVQLVWLHPEESKAPIANVAVQKQRRRSAPATLVAAAQTLIVDELVVPVSEGLAAPAIQSPGAGELAVPVVQNPAGEGFGDTDRAHIGGEGGTNHQRLAQERISHVANLIGNALARRLQRSGVAKVNFHSDPMGYVEELEIVESAGVAAFDHEVPTILHLAEPYPRNEAYKAVVKFECAPAI